MASMNKTYMHMYDVLDNVEVLEAKLQSALEDLGRNEESMKRMEAIEASRVEEFAKSWNENKELKHKLWDSQVDLHALENDHTVVTAKVSILEERARTVEERAAKEEFIRVVAIQEAVEQAIDNFK